ncbi:hypothetical protein [Alkalimarinus alittae]|uniref:Glycosyltransferase 2-like domain-containing protein n=1 Tax=Alkalimarinus alittae TaxID=2961619 RepID=A0ABY6N5M5_9ALTE|nr:hypothetical protein [Alkalimarinus alittae]UZE97282.1 hypothetical protein NKI27_05895 [Alkalimarinus alittae]
MNIVRITDTTSSNKDRNLYRLIENFNNFTLLECKNRGSILLDEVSNTLILDHIDEAIKPLEIIQQVLNSSLPTTLLIVVDGNQHYELPLPNQYLLSKHIIL